MNLTNGRVVVCAGLLAVMAGNVASADVVTSWNEELMASVRSAPLPPPQASRAMAMVHAAVYDAVNSVDGGHLPYRYFQASHGASQEAAAAQAAHRVLTALFPSRAAIYDAKLATDLGAIPNGVAKTQGVGLGIGAGDAILAARSADGSTATSSYQPSNPAIPGRWQRTPPANAAPLAPQWGGVTPFALGSGSQFRPPAPPTLGSAEYAQAYNEVKDLGSATSASRTADQTAIARSWAFGGGTVTPPGSWNQIARDIAQDRGNSVAENARMFAMLNVASADAAIACWEAKYEYDLWRPITAIRNGDVDGNAATEADAAWSSLLTTPNFPGFTSGHSTFSRAAATILQQFFGTDAISFTLVGDNGINRTFTSLDAAANEAGLSRIYGGIHFNFDNIAGQDCGLAVANWVSGNYFQIPTPGAGAVLAVAGVVALRRRR